MKLKCKECGNEFLVVWHGQLYCNSGCRKRHNRRENRHKKAQEKKDRLFNDSVDLFGTDDDE